MHHLRVSASRQIEIINQSLAVYQEMKAHLESCTMCNDEGICTLGQESLSRLDDAQRRLRQIGFEQ